MKSADLSMDAGANATILRQVEPEGVSWNVFTGVAGMGVTEQMQYGKCAWTDVLQNVPGWMCRSRRG